ncbi:MAG TPA: hypothetical protein VF549_17500 [Solirubrobacteraceae bacterium]|jgi:hypothetical protein
MTTTHKLWTTALAVLAAALAAAFIASTGGGGAGSASAAPPGDVPAESVAAAAALGQTAEMPAALVNARHSEVADLRAAGARLQRGVPLPPGGGIDVNWEAAAAQGGDNETGMRGVILYQASCEWYRYALGHEVTPQVAAVLNSIPTWPGFRGQDYAHRLSDVAESIVTGDGSLARAHVGLNCG